MLVVALICLAEIGTWLHALSPAAALAESSQLPSRLEDRASTVDEGDRQHQLKQVRQDAAGAAVSGVVDPPPR